MLLLNTSRTVSWSVRPFSLGYCNCCFHGLLPGDWTLTNCNQASLVIRSHLRPLTAGKRIVRSVRPASFGRLPGLLLLDSLELALNFAFVDFNAQLSQLLLQILVQVFVLFRFLKLDDLGLVVIIGADCSCLLLEILDEPVRSVVTAHGVDAHLTGTLLNFYVIAAGNRRSLVVEPNCAHTQHVLISLIQEVRARICFGYVLGFSF